MGMVEKLPLPWGGLKKQKRKGKVTSFCDRTLVWSDRKLSSGSCTGIGSCPGNCETWLYDDVSLSTRTISREGL